MEIPTLAHSLHKAFLMGGSRPFLGYPIEKKAEECTERSYTWLSFTEVLKYSMFVADGLREAGIPRQGSVGICAENTVEWLITDFACCFNDSVVVGIHSSWERKSLYHVLNSAGVVCIVCNENDVDRFVKASESCPSLQMVLVVDSLNMHIRTSAVPRKSYVSGSNNGESPRIYWMSDMFASQKPKEQLQTITRAGSGIPSWFGVYEEPHSAEADEPYTLLYTSGTTGAPKGVSVSKRRWLMDAQSNSFPGQPAPAVASYMSLAHGGDRGICWQACFGGARVGMINNSSSHGDLQSFLRDLTIVRPTFFLGMSHLWCECYAVYKRELELATVQAIASSSSKIRAAVIELYENSIQGIGGAATDDEEVFKEEVLKELVGVPPVDSSPLHSSALDDEQVTATGTITDPVQRDQQFKFDICMAAAQSLFGWDTFIDAMAKILGIKDLLLLDWYDRFGGRVFIPVTGGGHTSDEVVAWMNAVFMPPTSMLKDQSSRVKNAYGLSEFPGISVNGVVNSNIELELVPVPENDIISYEPAPSDKRGESATNTPLVVIRRGERFDPDAAITPVLSERTSHAKVDPDRNDAATATNTTTATTTAAASTLASTRTQFARYRRGEIRVRHRDPSIRILYWNDPDATAASVKNGWFYTGDVGELDYGKLDEDGRPTLRIIDRVSNMTELYINGDSVWVEQARLEAEVYASVSAVDRICLLSDRNQPCLVAVVVPNRDFVLKAAEALKIPLLSPRATRAQAEKGRFHYLCSHPTVKAAVLASLVATAKTYTSSATSSTSSSSSSSDSGSGSCSDSTGDNGNINDNGSKGAKIKPYEVPAAVILDSEAWTSDNGLLTLTGKPRRDRIRDKFITQIEQAYAALSEEGVVGSVSSTGSTSGGGESVASATASSLHIVPVNRQTKASPYLQEAAATAAAAATESHDLQPATTVNSISLNIPRPLAQQRHDSSDDPAHDLHEEEVEATRRAAIVSYFASVWSAAPIEDVSIWLPAVLELSVQLLQPLARILQVASTTVGPSAVKDSGLPLGWGGYIKQNESTSLPYYANSGEKRRDYIGFRFTCANEGGAQEVNSLLDEMRTQVVCRRENFSRWSREVSEKAKAAEEAALRVLRHHTMIIDNLVAELEHSIQSIIDHNKNDSGSEGDLAPYGGALKSSRRRRSDVSALFEPLFEALTNRLVVVRQAYAQCDEAAGEHPELTKSMNLYCRASDRLRIIAPRRGARIPPVIDLGGWFSASANSEDEIKEAERASAAAAGSTSNGGAGNGNGNGSGGGTLSQSLGDAKVWCSVSGELIERDLHSSGKPRYHCLDLQGVDRSLHSHELVHRIIRLVNMLVLLAHDSTATKEEEDAGGERGGARGNGHGYSKNGIESILKLLCRSYPINPSKLSIEELLKNKGCVWTFEHAHFWHLRDQCEFPLVVASPQMNGGGWVAGTTRYMCVDTPASFITRACHQFANRIALGIPDPDEILFDPTHSELKFPHCALTQAAQISLIRDRGYLWITYSELYHLAVSVAKIIRFYVPRGSFIGISGYNGIEWAVCDIACALAGCVSVGLHSTYDAPSAYHAIAKADIALLLCAADLIYSSSSSSRWPTSSGSGGTEEGGGNACDAVVTRANKDTTTADGPDDDSFWTVEKVLEVHANDLKSKVRMIGGCVEDGLQLKLKQIIVLDLSVADFDRRYSATSTREMSPPPLSPPQMKKNGIIALAQMHHHQHSSIVDYLPGVYASHGVASPVSVSSLVDLIRDLTAMNASQEISAEEHQVPVPPYHTSSTSASPVAAAASYTGTATDTRIVPVAVDISPVVLEPPEQQPADGRSSIFTILFTSGSTGQPKGVVVSAAGFFNDISSRNYVEPLVTVSYIPLSHSSDRLKMWEFLGNGGRVGFAHYSPSNWIDHETTKKNESLQSAGVGSNDVEGLFRQVASLQPTAMACPPNIWNGLYHLFREELVNNKRRRKEAGGSGSTDSESESESGVAGLEEQQARKVIAAMLGPRIKFLVTGGAPTAPEVIEFAKSLFPRASFADSYGATECGAITSNGVPIREKRVEVMLGPVDGVSSETEGELWVHSPNMSIGYYKDDEQTRKSFVKYPDATSTATAPAAAASAATTGTVAGSDGKLWYKTGDLVRIIEKGRYVDCSGGSDSSDGWRLWLPKLAILGRISSAVRLAGPDKVVVSPDILEGIYAVSSTLSQIFVHAQRDSRALVAIVVAPRSSSSSVSNRSEKASGRRSPACYDDTAAVVGDVGGEDDRFILEVKAELGRVAKLNGLRSADIPSAVYIERRIQWTHENGMLNASHKKSRSAFLKYYSRVLQELHAPFIERVLLEQSPSS